MWRPLSLYVKTTVTLCEDHCHFMWRPLSLYVKTTVILCEDHCHFVWRPLSLYVKTTVTLCEDNCHFVWRPLSLCVKITVILCEDHCHFMWRQLSLYVKTTLTLCEDHCHFMWRPLSLYVKTTVIFITTHSVLLRMRNVSNKSCRGNQNTHFVLNNFFSNIVPLWDNLEKNNVEWGRPQMRIRRISITCWITKATNTHSQYVIIIAFPLQQCLQERASMLRCVYCYALFI